LEVILKNNSLRYEKKAQEHYCTTEDDNLVYKHILTQWQTGGEKQKQSHKEQIQDKDTASNIHYKVWKIDRKSQRYSPDRAGNKNNCKKSKSKHNT